VGGRKKDREEKERKNNTKSNKTVKKREKGKGNVVPVPNYAPCI
jgi:hypothetical protein